VWKTELVQLSGKNRALNEYSVERVGEEVKETLVMVHGYGAGLGFFYKNYEPLTRIPGWRLYSLDLLGMGNSVCYPFLSLFLLLGAGWRGGSASLRGAPIH